MKEKNRILVLGISGQDGSFMAEQLLQEGSKVYGMIRRTATPNTSNITHLLKDIELVEGDMLDYNSLRKIIQTIKPDEIYNLAAQSHVQTSYDQPIYTTEVNALGVVRLLNAVVDCNLQSKTRIYQAGTSEMFGNIDIVANEQTPMHPVSPYAISKLYAYHIVKMFRQGYNMFAVCGILFNHESERRGKDFVTMKIVNGLKKILPYVTTFQKERELGNWPLCPEGLQLHLGNLDARRDWGHAEDYVRAIVLMLRNERPKDYVVCMNESHSVREFVEAAMVALNLPGRINDYVVVDPKFYRPVDFDLRGNSSLIRSELGWVPKYSFEDLVRRMCSEKTTTKDIKLDINIKQVPFSDWDTGTITIPNPNNPNQIDTGTLSPDCPPQTTTGTPPNDYYIDTHYYSGA